MRSLINKPSSINPYFLYSSTAFVFVSTTVNEIFSIPTASAHNKTFSSSALPIPCPQYSFDIHIPNSALCLNLVSSLPLQRVNPSILTLNFDNSIASFFVEQRSTHVRFLPSINILLTICVGLNG